MIIVISVYATSHRSQAVLCDILVFKAQNLVVIHGTMTRVYKSKCYYDINGTQVE